MHYEKSDKKSGSNRNLILAELGLIIFIAISAFFVIFFPEFSANIIAQGGNVTRVDVGLPDSNFYWYGLYGNLSELYPSSTVNIDGSQKIINFNPGVLKCDGAELYITTLSSIDFDTLTQASQNDINNYLGVVPSSPYSGQSIFTSADLFNISNKMTVLRSVWLNPARNDFRTGIMKQNNTLVFVSTIITGSAAFNGVETDYEVMLPVPLGSSEDYNYFLDPEDYFRCNEAPMITSITFSPNIEQGKETIVIVNWMDPNGDPATLFPFFNYTTITYTSPTSAIINWTPKPFEIGWQNITFNITDNYGNTREHKYLKEVTDINDPPIIQYTQDIYGYIHVPIRSIFIARDDDGLNGNLQNESVEFDFVPHNSWLDIKNYYNYSDNRFYGLLNFTPYTSQVGRYNLTLIATDGKITDSQDLILDIGYCGDFDDAGDSRCDSDYEDCASCQADCGFCDSGESDYMAFEILKRECNNKTIIRMLDLTKRATCELEGVIIDGHEVCGYLPDVEVTSYRLVNYRWVEDNTYTSGPDGQFEFEDSFNQTFKLVATKSKFAQVYKYLGKSYCYVEKEDDIIEPPVEIIQNQTKPKANETEIIEDIPGVTKTGYGEIKMSTLIAIYATALIIAFFSCILIHQHFVNGRKLETVNKEIKPKTRDNDQHKPLITKEQKVRIKRSLRRFRNKALDLLGF